ncbi:MAG: hypothetical protein NVS2B7_09690 [Herpetosiphon sp.]
MSRFEMRDHGGRLNSGLRDKRRVWSWSKLRHRLLAGIGGSGRSEECVGIMQH